MNISFNQNMSTLLKIAPKKDLPLSLVPKQSVSFGTYDFFLKNFSDIPCAYSGETTISSKKRLFLENTCYLKPAKYTAKILKPLADKLPPVEKDVATFFIQAATEQPDKNTFDLIKEIAAEKEPIIQESHKAIFKEMHLIASSLTGTTRTDVMNRLPVAFIDNNKRIPASFCQIKPLRGFLMSLKRKIQKDEPNNLKLMKSLITKTYKLHNSSTSADAFYVKYAEKKEPLFIHRLLEPIIATAEHIKPHSKGGVDNSSNFLLVSQKKNELRGDTDFYSFISTHKEIIPNIEKSFNDSCKKIKTYLNNDKRIKNESEFFNKKNLFDKEINKITTHKNKINKQISNLNQQLKSLQANFVNISKDFKKISKEHAAFLQISTYPKKVAKTIKTESHGLINIQAPEPIKINYKKPNLNH